MNTKKVRYLVNTAILIALAIVFQNLRLVLGGTNPVSTYIIGSLVNLCLIVASVVVGLVSGVSVAVVTPLIALAQGHAQLPMVPWIIAGNVVLVLCYALIVGKKNAGLGRYAVAGVLAAADKFAIIALGQALVLVNNKGQAFPVALGIAATAQLQQIFTALIAMVLGRLVIAALPEKLKA